MPDSAVARRSAWRSRDPVPGDRGEPGALFVARPGGGDTGKRGVTILRGTTDQGQTFHINLDGDRATLIDTRLEGMCPNGRPWDLRWYPADGNPVPFQQEGNRLRVSESGTMTMHARFTGSGREPYECNAEGVRFSVRR